MQSVETMVHYSRGDQIEQEAPHEIEDKKHPPEWPANGSIEFENIVLQYRPGLPYVLKGLSLTIRGGEKIGVVGRCAHICCFETNKCLLVGRCRTGAGKSSLLQALFRSAQAVGKFRR